MPLTSSEPERRSVNEYARSIGPLFDLRKAYSRLFDLCPNLNWELEEGLSTRYIGFFTDEYIGRGDTGIDSTEDDYLNFEDRGKYGLLNVSAFRAWFHLGLAMQKGIMYVPSDFRALFIPSDIIIKSSAETIIKKLEKTFETKVEESATWFEDPSPDVKIHFPLFVIRVALEVRNSDAALRFREICKTLDEARKEGDMRAVSNMTKEIDKQLQMIGEPSSRKPTFNLTLSFPPSISFPIGSDMIDTIKKLRNQRNFVFLRNVFDGSRDPRHILDTKISNVLREHTLY
jgi:hypothetical protein